VCTIPTAAAYDSMNLAQAVAVLAYEISVVEPGEDASRRGTSPRPAEPPRRAEPARHATIEALWDRLAGLFAAVGYSNPQNPEHILADWRMLLARAEPTQREVELLLAAVRAIERKLRLS
jgi:tRNA/rRNA methyltransferase